MRYPHKNYYSSFSDENDDALKDLPVFLFYSFCSFLFFVVLLRGLYIIEALFCSGFAAEM